MSALRRRWLVGVAVAAGMLAGPLLAKPQVRYDMREVAAGLSFPWCVAFLPGGDWLVTERSGALKRISGNTISSIGGVPQVYARSQGGLFDILLHPQFAQNRRVFLSYAHGPPEANTLRVARAELRGNELVDLKVIFEVQPVKDTPAHYGGRMAFLPDGSLLINTGDGFEYREAAQRLDNLMGKTVRLHEDGSVPVDNPFVKRAGARPEIWTFGHRNAQGLAVDAASGTVYQHEHGPRGGDELNLLEAGNNYGWPVITWGVDYSGARISPYTTRDGMEQPLAYWIPSIAPAGMAIYDGNEFPEWRGDLFVAALVERAVRRVRLRQGKVVEQEVLFAELQQRMRDVRVGPDGCLYLLTDSDSGSLMQVCAAKRAKRTAPRRLAEDHSR